MKRNGKNCTKPSESLRWNWTGCKNNPESCDGDGETRMYRTGSPTVEHSPAMRVDGAASLELVLRSAGRDGGEPASDAVVGRAVHADSVLRQSADGHCAPTARLERQPQARPTVDAADGDRGDLSQAAIIRSRRRVTRSIPTA